MEVGIEGNKKMENLNGEYFSAIAYGNMEFLLRRQRILQKT